MSIDKWLIDDETKEKRKEIDEVFETLSDDEVRDLKKTTIKELTRKKKKEIKGINKVKVDDFFSKIIEFKDWLNQRTYLKGDLDKIEMWIKNLNNRIRIETEQNAEKETKTKLIGQFRRIPPKFLDEKTRIVINKVIWGSQTNSSDSYYLKKLKVIINEKLKEAEYYKILKNILQLNLK